MAFVPLLGALRAVVVPSNLSVEYGAAIVDTPLPRFSWQLQSADRAVVQRSFEIRVAAENGTLLWSSGVVEGAQQLHVEYAGAPLEGDRTYNWSVCVWTASAAASAERSAYVHATFGTAFFDPAAEWRAAPWITSAPGLNHGQFRASFTLPVGTLAAIDHARIYLVGLGYGQIALNGVRRLPDELGPWTTWTKRVLYRAFDLPGGALRDGENVLGVRLGNGQWNSRWTHAWHKGSPPLLLRVQLRLRLENGSSLVVAPPAHAWRSSPGAVIANDVYAGETYDARLEQRGWDTPGFANASAWPVAVEATEAAALLGNLSLHMFTPTKAIASHPAIAMWSPAQGVFVFDFGANRAGWATLRVRGRAGETVRLAYGEQLRNGSGICLARCANGTVFYPFGGGVDAYTLRGDAGGETWAPSFTYHGFQFIQLEGWPMGSAPPTLQALTAEEVHADVFKTAAVDFSDDGGLLNRMHENLARSLLSNLHSVESDCPTRERVGWTGDAQSTAESATRILGMASFYSKWLQDMQDATAADGALSSTVPFAKHAPPVDPTWPSAYPQLVRLLFHYHADERVVRRHLPTLMRYVDYVGRVKACPNCRKPTDTRTQTAGGLPQFYMNGDWMEYRAQAAELSLSGPLLASLHYIIDLEIVAELAAVVGEPAGEAYAQRAVAMRAEFNRAYLVSDTHTCDKQLELRKGGAPLRLSCGDNGGVIERVIFASFGTPRGRCGLDGDAGNLSAGGCAANATRAIVSKACLGRAACSPSADTTIFGDPCVGTVKSLAVAVRCSANASAIRTYGAGQTNNAVPLYYALPPNAADSASVTASLVHDINETHAKHLTTGFVGNKYVLPVLTAAGYAALAMDVALQTSLPSWGYQIAHGATTLWENWSGEPDESDPDHPSHNHHFMGGYGQWLHDSVIGLRQGDGLAFSRLVVRPEVVAHVRLPSASARYALPRGEAAVAWARGALCDSGSHPASFSLNITVPTNSIANVTIPLSGCGIGTVTESGARVWPPVYALLLPPGIVSACADELPDGIAAATFGLGSGVYTFHAN